MNRVWFDTRPAHSRAVVGWWAWHTNWRFTPGHCRECHLRRKQGHKMSCSQRGYAHKPLPIWACLLLALFVGSVNASISYILAATGLPNTAGFWSYIAVVLIVAAAFNWLFWRVYTDWQRAR